MARGFANLTQPQQELAASHGSLIRWSRVNSPQARAAATAPARTAARRRLEEQADPTGKLPPAELAAAVKRLQKAHMRDMALKSAAKRRKAPPDTAAA